MRYRITPIDPLISRDARPFGAGNRVRSLEWLSQTVIAGAVRTALWKECEKQDEPGTLEALRSVNVLGAFPLLEGKDGHCLCFPRPLDIIAQKKGTKDRKEEDRKLILWQISPSREPEGCHIDMPLKGLRPSGPNTEEDFKPEKLQPFWTARLMTQWLRDGKENFDLNGVKDEEQNDNNAQEKATLDGPSYDERVHVNIDPQTGTAQAGMLFSTTGLDFVQKYEYGKPELKTAVLKQGQISIDVSIPQGSNLPALPERFTAPVGGERRLAEFERADGDDGLWNYPKELPESYVKGAKLRLVLATPAIFDKGWLPGWINEETLIGNLPGSDVAFKLVSAVTGRWQPISGWSYEKGRTGPKLLRRAVPAGSVYFLELLSDRFVPADWWLRSVCDGEQDHSDGFGLALWGRGLWDE